MAEWYVKDLSKLTQVSVQTLHHYDRIGLLKPSIRLENGYRLYTEKDLLKLQQIIALKFFGFELSKIKRLLAAEVTTLDLFKLQARVLSEKAKTFAMANKVLEKIIADYNLNKSIPWETIIKSIEVYHMSQQLQKTWAGKVLNEKELSQYVQFEQELKTRFTPDEEEKNIAKWHKLVDEVNASLTTNPASEKGIDLGRRVMEWVNNLYGNKYLDLRNAVWQKGFKGGHLNQEHGLTPEAINWLDKAMDAYYRGVIFNVLKDVNQLPDHVVLANWQKLLTDMYGDNEAMKAELIKAALQDKEVTQVAKDWLKKNQ